jgi:hypothetical protein
MTLIVNGRVQHDLPDDAPRAPKALFAEQVFLEGVTPAEVEGLYKLAVIRADAVAVANEALALLHRNDRLLTPDERFRVRELKETLGAWE